MSFSLLLAAFLAFFLGAKLPDIDLAPILWHHRSAWTHGPLWAFLVPFVAALWSPWYMVYAWPAFLVGITFHLFKDLFPKAWVGAALINFQPMKKTFKPAGSILWLLGSAIVTAIKLGKMVGWL
jgi:hypothetical protein